MLILYEVSLELQKAKFSKLNDLLACLVLNWRLKKLDLSFVK